LATLWKLAEALINYFSALNKYDGAIGQCIGQFRTGALTLGPIGPKAAPVAREKHS
jgi:hypothetical protein